ncbi:hypothetical protein NDU88_002343 [Pleurodeles waltl]|uniref:Uncharacterized protein n=1 Tax=Pleurodeles waltl TaxID=8319 RepID=A0AAV7M5P8_PLEWA|nr:hypothetical protein NDU88_002343 [Pleurodeles waltl]
MPSGTSGSKHPGKPAQQLLFTEALLQAHPMAAAMGMWVSSGADDSAGPVPDTTMDCILQEITALGHRLQGMNSNIAALTAEAKSIYTNIAGFQNRMTDLEHLISAAEERLKGDENSSSSAAKSSTWRTEVTGTMYAFLAFRNVQRELDVKGFLENILPALTGLTFKRPLELQRPHHVGLLQQDGSSRPRLIIACVMGRLKYSHKGSEIRIAVDFSRETNEHCKAFLPLLPHLGIKYGLFEIEGFV